MEKKGIAQKIVLWFIAALVMTGVIYASSITAHAVSGPRPSQEAGIVIGYTHAGDWEILYLGSDKKTSAKFGGFSYSKKTNTLTISNTGSDEDYYLELYDMGDDFTIDVKGKNSLGYIGMYSNVSDRMNLTITGSGSLKLNSGGSYGAAIHGYANGKSNTKVTIDNTVNVTLHGGENIFTGKKEKAIVVENAKSSKQDNVFRIGGNKTGSTTVVRKKTKKGYTYSYGSTGKLVIKQSGKSFLNSEPSKSNTTTKTSISKASISVSSITYNGKARKPSVTVKLNGNTLKKDSDYTVSYSNNINAGKKAVVTIKGIGNYKDTATKNFTIGKCSMGKEYISAELDKTSYEYTGKEITPGITVYFNGKTKLKKGTDYKVSYLYNKKIGKAYVEVTGKGNFESTSRLFGFNITKAKQPIEISTGSFSVPYAKVGESQDVTVSGIKESAGLTVTSSNTSVATIKKADSKYRITFRGAGTTKLKFKTNKETTHYKVTTKTIEITVVDNRKVPTITLPKQSYVLDLEDALFNLGATTESNGALTYTSSDNSIVTVDAAGNVTIKKKEGKATITVKVEETKTYKTANKAVQITVTDKSLYWPVRRGDDRIPETYISSHPGDIVAGNPHRGIDIGNADGAKWYSATDGTIVYIFDGCQTNGSKSHADCHPNHPELKASSNNYGVVCNNGFGNGCIIKSIIDGKTYYFQYAHMDSISTDLKNLKEGDQISKGTCLGTVGDRGFSFGTHAHFEIDLETTLGSYWGEPVNNDPERGSIFYYVY